MKRNIPEDLHNFNQSFLYPFVGFSDDCRVINWRTKSILAPSICTGYYGFTIKVDRCSKRVLLHRLIAERFIPTEKDMTTHHINHKDGNKLNNSLDNLEWVTLSENILHANSSGLRNSCKGFNHHSCKVTECDVNKACMYMSLHLSNKEVEQMVGLPNGFCNDIRRGKIWQDIAKTYNIPVKSNKSVIFYLMSLDGKYIKFGVTNNIHRRLIDTRCKSKPFSVELISYFNITNTATARQIEKAILDSDIPTGVISKGELPNGFSETASISDLPEILNIVKQYTPA